MAFIELDKDKYESVRRFADESSGESEYYNAIIDGRQTGKIYVNSEKNPTAVLFRHYAGYGFLAGTPDTEFTENVLLMVKQEHKFFIEDTDLKRRLILQQDDPTKEKLFENAEGLFRSKRLCFAYADANAPSSVLPEGYCIKTVNEETLSKMNGDVTPSFSWKSSEEFLRGGIAVCVMRGDTPVAWSFSGAIGGGRMDIGVETVADFRGRGFARAAAGAMVKIALDMGLVPVWGCDASNQASAKTAESIGFTQTCIHAKYKKSGT